MLSHSVNSICYCLFRLPKIDINSDYSDEETSFEKKFKISNTITKMFVPCKQI